SGGGLPVQGQAGDYEPEFSQPPLYYAIESVMAKLIPASGATVPDFAHHNPYQNATPNGNVNLYSHPASEGFPWTGQILQLHAMRLVNLLFVAVTLAATYGIGREVGLSPGLALAAGAALGLLPQFDFIAGVVNADNAITAASALALYLLLRGLGRPPSAHAGVLLGLATAAAMLSKLSGLGVLLLVVGFLLWRAWRERKPGFVAQAAVCGATALALGGWWYIRNVALYGDILGWRPMLTAIGAMLRPRTLSPFEAAAVVLGQAPTAVGVFGWNNLRLPAGAYLLVAGIVAAGVLGLLLSVPLPPRWERNGKGVAVGDAAFRRGTILRLILLLAWIILFAASLVRWVEVNADAAQWRLLFPAFPALAVVLMLGLARLSRALAALIPLATAGLSAASLLLVVGPAYRAEQAYAGPIQHQLNVRYGDRLDLVGYDDPQPRAPQPGQPVALTLYWRALEPLELDDIVDLVALDVANQPAFKESTWPLDGRAPTSTWLPGQIVRDRHILPGTPHLAPGAYTFFLDVFQPLE
ncbi:MAG: glycosyltransferase family 39 protein, partial [Chloroflexota bacterium]